MNTMWVLFVKSCRRDVLEDEVVRAAYVVVAN